ncbi:MAG: urea carboxylase [Candidatus Thiodiazotropha sp.]
MFNKVLIANRGAIACRIIRTLKSMGVHSVAVYSEADRHSAHVSQADEAFCIGPAPASESYLDYPKLLQLAQQQGVDAIHPGYGFLSENAAFAEACEAAGIAFIGPTPQQMRDFGLKHTARQLAEQNQVPLLPGTGLLDDLDQAKSEALRIGYPVMLKSTAGGGGIGMQLCRSESELAEVFHSVARLALNNFSQSGIFLEKYIEYARHIEVQIFGDGEGRVVALGERDCSVQRRNQKVIEETPAPGLSEQQRADLMRSSVRLAEAVAYRSAGTVEFVYDTRSHAFYFLEVNTRLQVEHGVTEEVTGVDLVAWMVRLAAGERDFLDDYQHQPQGSAIQVRLYAEDPGKAFQPSSGLLTEVRFDPQVRVDTWIETGSQVPAYYDPMLAKVIVKGDSREATRTRLLEALNRSALYGIENNLDYLRQIVADPVFVQGEHYTRYLDQVSYQPPTIDVLAPGTQTTVQDYPGRTGYWDVGIPPSGPMDALAFRLANRLVGNPAQAAGLELTLNGPSLKFNHDCTIALTGAVMQAQLDGESVEFWRSLSVKAGSVLKLGAIEGSGVRAYLAVSGGFDVPEYMGSRATFTLGQFGGHAGRALQVGDVLRIEEQTQVTEPVGALATALIPEHSRNWEIHVMYGPHGAPDFFTDGDIETFFATDWEVHYNSSRTGVRLIGPKPQWARSDGGEAGLHPSNIHDNAYAIGSVDFTGDMPVILGPDGPSLGGFVCPVTIISADLWKVGQLSPGDRIRFKPVTYDEAVGLEQAQDEMILRLSAIASQPVEGRVIDTQSTPIVAQRDAQADAPAVCYRQSGDKYLLVEYGPLVLDLELRFRVHALMEWLRTQAIEGLLDLTPGIRSLQIHYDSRTISQAELVARLLAAESQLPSIDEMSVPSRIVHLPLSWDDPSTRLAIDKYMQSVRADAPWCPSNIEFIRRINGLESIEQVQEILFNASYLVMGLGDVYLGAPVATPLDPRHRLVTTKYNPARTWTPENAVGIGGAYLCVYGMEGPGGYQFVGRTVQMWNRYHQTRDFTDGKQWLLRFFDQLRFYPVSEQELKQMREDFPQGRFNLRIEETTLKLGDYRDFLQQNAGEIECFKQRQQNAFDAERQRWEEAGQATYSSDLLEDVSASDAGLEIPQGCLAVASSVTGSVWELAVKPGDKVEIGDPLIIIEAMKMEITIAADEAGTIREVLASQGSPVSAGQAVVILEMEAS